MRESPHPLEIGLGMRYYASDCDGIGGRLRTVPEDFIVEEIPCETGGEGPFLICRLTKTGWDQQRAIREVARRLGISYKRIGFSGTKDKHATTSQLISIRDMAPEAIEAVQLKDIRLEVVGTSATPLTLGLHQANRFTITIRDAEPGRLDEIVPAVSGTCREGLPNYFGIQRFGVIRPITHSTGALILKGDFRGAVLHYAGQDFPGEPADVREARAAFRETEDARAAIRAFPLPLSYERSMLHHLADRPGDYRGALLVLPPKLLSLLISGYQSWLFNCALSHRIESGGSLLEPAQGDRLLFHNGREDLVTDGNVASAAVQIRRQRCRIAIRMPGCSRGEGQAFSDTVFMDSLLEREGITSGDFCRVSDLARTRFEGASRAVALSAGVEHAVSGRDVRLSFSLGPGQYATTVCREYMKSDPLTMI